jgi:cell wall-associated NlpC family hydrolase
MTKGERVVRALPAWDRTRFHPHSRLKSVGVDCKGLLWGVAEELGFPEAKSEYARSLDYDLTKREGIPSGKLREGFAALFDRVETLEPGDILLCKWGNRPGHIAIYAGDDRAWHAIPSSGVRCRKLDVLFHKFPLDSIWRWR